MGSRHEITTVDDVSGTHEFTIRNYSQMKGIGVGLPVRSERFTVDSRAWHVGFYPDGYSVFDLRDPALFVQTVYSPEFIAFHAEFAFQLLDPDNGGRVIYERHSVARRFDGVRSSWGIRRFICRKQLEGEALRGDSLNVRCTVSVLKPAGPRSRVYPPLPEVPVPPSCFAENVVRFLASGRAPFDVKFVVDGVVLEAHRLVLASQSPWFDTLLYAHWSSSSSDDSKAAVEIRGTSPEMFRSVLHYIYNDKLPDAADEAMTRQLFIAADMYLLERLKKMCASRLCRFIQDGTATAESIMELAESHSCVELQHACQSYLAHH